MSYIFGTNKNALLNYFGFPKNFSPQFRNELDQHIKYVASNDLKRDQDAISKQFVLGFYYFQIQLSHQNPLLFKRIWSLNLKTILQKGQQLYKLHIQCLIKQVQKCQVFTIVKSKYKGVTFLASQLSDKGLISDLGSILAFYSVKYNFQNLGIIYKMGAAQYKLSLRSHQFLQRQPKALVIAQFYGGGGHHCAAGCSLDKKTFKDHFKSQGKLQDKIKISRQQIQNILYYQSK